MKILILLLALTLPSLCYGQYAQSRKSFDLHLSRTQRNEPGMKAGPMVMVGGATFIVAGLATVPTYVGGSTTEKKPFYAQVRNLPILVGSLLLSTGLVITITGH